MKITVIRSPNEHKYVVFSRVCVEQVCEYLH